MVVTCGECMVELTRPGAAHWLGAGWSLGYGGDVFNTTLYMVRLGVPVQFLTALGQDDCSDELLERWREDGVDVSMVLRHPSRLPALYAVRTDPNGERRFSYWRTQSAMRALFDLPGVDEMLERASSASMLYLSGITLSLFDAAGTARLVALAEAVRRGGGRVAFDPNYRAAGWTGADAARASMTRIMPFVSIALPTLEDELLLWDLHDADAVAGQWRAAGADEVVIKQGARGCLIAAGNTNEHLPAEQVRMVVDTTGAGDAFNAAYLAARLRGGEPRHAAMAGHALAARVVQHPGAIMPAST